MIPSRRWVWELWSVISISAREARLGEHLTVSTEPMRKGRTSFVLRHEIVNANDELVADAHVVNVTIDLKSRRASPIPNALAKMFG